MKTLKPILAALALTIAATVSAQTLKMQPQVVEVTTTEITAAVGLVVVKPEIKFGYQLIDTVILLSFYISEVSLYCLARVNKFYRREP